MKPRSLGSIASAFAIYRIKWVAAVTSEVNGILSMPPGCSCLGTEGTTSQSSECYQFDCDCTCDLTALICDRDCCCDPDCDEQALSTFKCSDSDFTFLPKCSDIKNVGNSGELSAAVANPSLLEDFITDGMENLLCVQRDNSAMKGSFFEPTTMNPSISNAGSDFRRVQLDHKSLSIEETQDGNYVFKDKIQSVHRRGSGELRSIGYLNLPSKSDGGFCDELNAVEFGVNFHNDCISRIENLDVDCENRFSIDQYTSSVSVLKLKTSSTSINFESMKNSFIEIDHVTVTSLNGTIIQSPSTIWDANNQSCNQAVHNLIYNISLSSDGTIKKVEASITVMDILKDTRTIHQDFSSIFSSNSMIRKSGNPGYTVGAQIIAGKRKDPTKGVELSHDGLTVSDTGHNGGDCLAAPKSYNVRFGEDSTVGCTVAMTQEELETICTAQVHPYFKLMPNAKSTTPLLIPKWLAQDIDMVGIFGNADPADISQWQSLINLATEEDFKVKSRIWNPTQKRCSGIITGVKYRFFWSYVGSVSNPQAKIIRVEEEYDGNLPLTHLINPEKEQRYSFTTTITWVFVESEEKALKLPPPNLLFSVPDDIFYPFSYSAGRSLGWSAGLQMSIMVILILFIKT